MTRAVETDSGMKYYYGEAEITQEEYEKLSKGTEGNEAVQSESQMTVRRFVVSLSGNITEVIE